jgi:hypothetical protein
MVGRYRIIQKIKEVHGLKIGNEKSGSKRIDLRPPALEIRGFRGEAPRSRGGGRPQGGLKPGGSLPLTPNHQSLITKHWPNLFLYFFS